MSGSENNVERDEPSSVEELVAEFGPFEPPEDYEFEPELRNDPPRHIPSELNQGRYARGRRKGLVVGLLTGFLCASLSLVPAVKFAALFLLPLAYLGWIGLAIIGITLVGYLLYLFRKGPFAYVENGSPLVVRICSLVVRPRLIFNGEPTAYECAAIIQFRHPATGQLTVAETVSNEFAATQKGGLTTSYNVGDHATAVYLGSDPDATLRLYGFLDLRPGLGLVKRDDQRPDSLLATATTVLVMFSAIAALFWSFYAYEQYSPLETTTARFAVPMAIGSALFGGLGLWLMLRDMIKTRNKIDTANRVAVAEGKPVELDFAPRGWFGKHGKLMGSVIVLGLLLIGGLTMVSLACTVNALLDSSPPRPQPVMITDMIMTTHSYVLRHYEIKYEFPDDDETRSMLSTPAEMNEFTNHLGIAMVRDGWLGWEWVESIEPVVVQPAAAEQ